MLRSRRLLALLPQRVEDLALGFEKRDAWIGVYWDRDVSWDTSRSRDPVSGKPRVVGHYLRLYVCVIPFLPVIVTLRQGGR